MTVDLNALRIPTDDGAGQALVDVREINFTKNAAQSFENAIVVQNTQIAGSFMQEYSQVAALSEPLDWTSDWVEPEWRIGT